MAVDIIEGYGKPRRPHPLLNPFYLIKNLVTGRIDQGVDFTAYGPILAAGSGRVLFINPNWYNGLPYVSYSTVVGNIYVAEHIHIQVAVGQKIDRGTVIGMGYGGIETGWARADGKEAAAKWHFGPGKKYGDLPGQIPATPEGISFARFLKQLKGFGGSFRGGSKLVVTPYDCASALWDAGMRDYGTIRILVAIAGAESNYRLYAVGDNGTSFGVWQEHTLMGKQQAAGNLAIAASLAIQKYNSQGLTAWTTYRTGAYIGYLPRASRAVAQLKQQGPESKAAISAIGTTAQATSFGGLGGMILGGGTGGLINDLFGGVRSVADAIVAVGKFLIWLMSPEHWIRVAEFIGGAILIILAFYILAKPQMDANVGNATRLVAFAA